MTKTIYNAQWAKKNLAMPDLLSVFGHEPVRTAKAGNEYWYISPFRYEKEPSFHTSYVGDKWIWNDFGRGDIAGSGTVIGFLELHENVNVSEALQILKNLFPQAGRSSLKNLRTTPLFKNIELTEKQDAKKRIEEKLIITEINETIWDKRLIGYLAGERCINHKLALRYLKHIKYTNVQTGKNYDTIRFINESGDYECRDKYFKGILKSPDAQHRNTAKDISYIPGTGQKHVAIFEGFMDFLTILTIKNVPVLPVDVIVLNMVNMRRRAIDFIRHANYEQVFTFFDNDSSGEKTTQVFEEDLELKGKVKPQNHLYKGFKDYNRLLKGKPIVK
jgi:5S rRNA maturation endonuclease (ribonuclease M5)